MDISFLQTAVSGTNAAEYTFSSQSIGAADSDRYIICCVAWRASADTTLSSVSIGGVAATLLANNVNVSGGETSGTCIAVAAVPSGTTGDVVVTIGATALRCGIALYRAVGLGTPTVPHDTLTSDADSPTGTIDIPNNGLCIGIAYNASQDTNAVSWTGLTEDFEASIEGGGDFNEFSGAQLLPEAGYQLNLTVTATYSLPNPNLSSGSFVSWDGGGLLSKLKSYWKLDETSDGSGAVTREDSHGPNDLTDNNTTPSGTGKISLGANMEQGSSEFLSIADASQTGLDITSDLSIAGWVNLESDASMEFLAKSNTVGNQRGYRFRYNPGATGTELLAGIDDDGAGGVDDGVAWSPTADGTTLYHIGIAYDASAGSVQFFINGVDAGTVTGFPTSIFNSSAQFNLGAFGTGSNTMDGIQDEFGIWARLLTEAEFAELYNAGAGLAYPFESEEDVIFLKPININQSVNRASTY